MRVLDAACMRVLVRHSLGGVRVIIYDAGDSRLLETFFGL